MEKFGTYIDVNVLVTNSWMEKRSGFSRDFIYFLERNPVGLITHRVDQRVLKILGASTINKRESFYRYYELKEHLRVEEIDKEEYIKNLKEVKPFLHALSFRNSSNYQNSSGDDAERLTEAVCIKPRHEILCFATLDKDFLHPQASENINKRFKIKCGYPIDILKEVKTII